MFLTYILLQLPLYQQVTMSIANDPFPYMYTAKLLTCHSSHNPKGPSEKSEKMNTCIDEQEFQSKVGVASGLLGTVQAKA